MSDQLSETTVTGAARAISALINSRSSSPRLDELEEIIGRVAAGRTLACLDTPLLRRVRTALGVARDATRRYSAERPDDDAPLTFEFERSDNAVLALEVEIPRPATEPDQQLALALIAAHWITHNDDTDLGQPEARCAIRLLEGLLLRAGETADPLPLKLERWLALCRVHAR